MSFETRLRAGLDQAAEPLDPDIERSLRSVLVRRHRRVVVRRATLVLATAAAAVVSVLGIRFAIAPQPDQASGAVQIVGSYRVVLTAQDGSGVAPSVEGEWRMRLQADGVVVLTAPATFQAERNPAGVSYDATETTFTTNVFVNDFCNSVGSYIWQSTAGELVFQAVDDDCGIRSVLLTSKPWTRTG
jgi:hypothetical protein